MGMVAIWRLTFGPNRRRIIDIIGIWMAMMQVERLFPRVRFRPQTRPNVTLDGFADVSTVMSCGVYVLVHLGRVVYVGWSRQILNHIAGHDRLAHQPTKPWFTIPGVVYDQVLVHPCHPEAAEALVADLIAEYRPRKNLPCE